MRREPWGRLLEIAESDDKTEGIACKGLFPVYEQNRSYSVGDVRLNPTTGSPKECILAYDGSNQPDWRLTQQHFGNLGIAAKRNMLSRGKRRPGRTIYISLGST